MFDKDLKRLQILIHRLHETENLTDSLTDDDAELLLDWAEQQLRDTMASDIEVDPESVSRQLHRVVRAINRLVGQRADLTETQFIQKLIGLVEHAMELAVRQHVTPQAAAPPALDDDLNGSGA